MNKNTLTAIIILFSGLAFALAFYFGVKTYFINNPIVVCGEDKYSDACLTQYAIDLKLDRGAFIKCIQSNNYTDNIAKDENEALILGLNTAPSIFVGELTDNTTFVGFFISPADSSEMKDLADNILSNGIVKAQEANLAVIAKRINENVKAYLESQGLSAADYTKQLNELQPTIKTYLDSFALFSLKTSRDTVRGNPNSRYGFLYFADYGSSLNVRFYTVVLSGLYTDYIDNGKMMLVLKDLPISNELADSIKLARAARCAGEQNKYFEYSDILHVL